MLPLLALATALLATAPEENNRPEKAPAPVLLELYTSEGCSSCPAADAFVRELPGLGLGRDRVLPLAFHVDYWDGLGWKDPFASPAFTDRQRRYVANAALRGPNGERGLGGPYTPQMIVNGRVHFPGGMRELALAAIAQASRAAPRAGLDATATAAGERATIVARVTTPDARLPSTWRLVVALAQKSAETHPTRGENGGETLREAAIVRTLTTTALAVAGAPTQVALDKPAGLPWSAVEITAFVQDDRSLEVILARAVPLRPEAARPP